MAQELITKTIDSLDSIAYYQIDFIQKHPELPLLPLSVGLQKGQANLEIDITDMINISDRLVSNPFSRNEWIEFLIFIGETLKKSIDYFLEPCNFKISLSTIFHPTGQDIFSLEDTKFLYIPLLNDSAKEAENDPVFEICKELFQYFSSQPINSSSEDLGKILSEDEQNFIASWSLDNLEEGLAYLGNLLKFDITEFETKKDVCYKKPLLIKQIETYSKMVIKKFISTDIEGLPLIIGLVCVELALVVVAFGILKYQVCFSNWITPILLVSSALICCGFIDLFLLYNKKSPLYLPKSSRPDSISSDENDIESIFIAKEEKTVILENSTECKRIAMICSGIPGTPDESTGLKAYILVDDFLIGRDNTKVDFRINCLSVGKVHARILRKQNSFFVQDMESKNGTYLDNKKLKKNEEYLLPENCKLRFAEKEFFFVAN